MAGTSGTPKAKALGSRLRDARKTAGFTVRGLAEQLGLSHSAISRWETGARSPQPEDVASILAATGIGGSERSELLEMARGTDAAQWLSVHSGDRERQLAALLDFERAASHITDVAPLLIPGLLQTSDYARAIMVAASVPPAEIETRVLVRVGRREALMRRNPASLLALIGEAAIRQLIGGEQVVADQLRHLVDFGARPNVTIQVIPAASGWSPALEGPFLLIDLPNERPIVHLENRRSALFFHEAEDVDAYVSAVETVRQAAMSPERSKRLILDVIGEMEKSV
ncbi:MULTISPECIES: helix-turn-helix transcriptional regulator [unclassified Saccharopolyspora]|uniref:helix-turn-helix domain-containing protein n=1 Tax=unclassified Saccharopolyspora TaxID=2646250 RepID=UPI001CD7E246|nr:MULTISPECIES: helix-turn-helix transcriptional regulator [unclassified Saccharopolyspora]MCA1185110.1 helix-turn-helix domain-containing protein [Saccharopolyspora sp. 6T]MCA1191414.1 helix-turn-helix domain-containing protein [Saccharopolyspora sp. 6V]MCA1224985.1 helix-turn-helix domain-containing protein [Saccharopolyspora sp. 6M]MCA1278524.1 helix-turn-helix domain-containing protein [Saccharopolyspora sp. 7B]